MYTVAHLNWWSYIPGRTGTYNLRIRSPLHYPIMLREQKNNQRIIIGGRKIKKANKSHSGDSNPDFHDFKSCASGNWARVGKMGQFYIMPQDSLISENRLKSESDEKTRD